MYQSPEHTKIIISLLLFLVVFFFASLGFTVLSRVAVKEAKWASWWLGPMMKKDAKRRRTCRRSGTGRYEWTGRSSSAASQLQAHGTKEEANSFALLTRGVPSEKWSRKDTMYLWCIQRRISWQVFAKSSVITKMSLFGVRSTIKAFWGVLLASYTELRYRMGVSVCAVRGVRISDRTREYLQTFAESPGELHFGYKRKVDIWRLLT